MSIDADPPGSIILLVPQLLSLPAPFPSMCLLGIAFRHLPDAPLALLANREEAFARPATGPEIRTSEGRGPDWLGGTDLLAGGTWLGVNARGLVVAVTNRRREVIPLEPRSRGLLCRSLLSLDRAEVAVQSGLDQLQSGQYAGCNLLLADSNAAFVIEFGETFQSTELRAGLHLLTNGALDAADDLRIDRVRRELDRQCPTKISEWVDASSRICALRGADGEPPIAIEGIDRGTVSATVLALGRERRDSQYWHAPGPPARTSFIDYSPLLQGVLAGSAGVHRIPLRGPWRYRSSGGPEQSAKFPARWADLFGEWRGPAEFRRTFHPPTNLGEERVEIAIDGLLGPAVVSLNGKRLGEVVAGNCVWRVDVTSRLLPNSELLIEVGDVPDEIAELPGPIWRSVALEISDR